MTDIIRQTTQSKHLVIWEEIARDGAQAKTLMSGKQRVKIARAQSKIFGDYGPNHLIFAAGYPAICKEEFEAICEVADQVDTCSLATHGRMLQSDVDLGIEAMKRAQYGRVSFAIPIAESHSQIMLHQSNRDTLKMAIDLTRYAVDNADGLPIDIAFGGACREAPGFLAEAANILTEEGAASIKICDSAGEYYSFELYELFKELMSQIDPGVVIGAHFHNDMGTALAASLNAVRLGTRLVAGSWLGLAERNGLAATEQLLFALAYNPEEIVKRFRLDGPLWLSSPDLKRMMAIAHEISEMFNIPLKVTDPVISTAMNHISTGAYFNDPDTFKPFDPEKILGVKPKMVLTHLANHSIIKTIAHELGFELNREQVSAALAWVKTLAYQRGESEIPHSEFAGYLAKSMRS
jgi:isopropylmalate/homocitrate/citramalate synthase